jgi:hypothetical protein
MKHLFQQVWGRLQFMIAVGRDRLFTLAQERRYLVFPHYSGHTPFRNKFTIRQ